jgi:acetylornithine/succinyldiaminopimelate/putrescine aminotransferase
MHLCVYCFDSFCTGLSLPPQGLEIVTDAASRAPATAAASALTDRLRELGVACHATGDYSNVLKCKPPLTITLRAAEHYARALEVALSERCGAGAMAAARPTATPAKL